MTQRKNKITNYLNMSIGDFTVLKYLGRKNAKKSWNYNHHHHWECKCNGCGTIVEKTSRQLRSARQRDSMLCGACPRLPSRVRDWVGEKVHDFKVLSYEGKSNRDHEWLCECSCGNREQHPSSQLQSALRNRSFSCQKCRPSVQRGKLYNWAGERLHKLTVVNYLGVRLTDYGKEHRWLCKCDCGNTVSRTSTSLRDAKKNKRRVACPACTDRSPKDPVKECRRRREKAAPVLDSLMPLMIDSPVAEVVE